MPSEGAYYAIARALSKSTVALCPDTKRYEKSEGASKISPMRLR
jgi:hypothetical protein